MTWWLWLLVGWLAGALAATLVVALCAAAGVGELVEELTRLRDETSTRATE